MTRADPTILSPGDLVEIKVKRDSSFRKLLTCDLVEGRPGTSGGYLACQGIKLS